MKHIIAGYLIIEPELLPKWKTEHRLPEKLITATDCICSTHPGEWGLSWAASPDDVENVRKKLGITESEISTIQSEVQSMFDKGEYGLPNVFSTLDAAQKFRGTHLQKIETHIVRLALPDSWVTECISEMDPGGDLIKPGYQLNLRKNEVDREDGKILGYEVLCWDVGAFHSFICNGLEKDYEEKLGIKLNQNGLINDLEDAVRATEYTNRGDVGAEPGYWAPFRLSIEITGNDNPVIRPPWF